MVLEITARAVTSQEKNDQVKYHKDVAQMIKTELDNQKRYVFIHCMARSRSHTLSFM